MIRDREDSLAQRLLGTLLRFDSLAFVALVGFFLVFPRFDLLLTGQFYFPEQGGFIWKDHFLNASIYSLTDAIGAFMILGIPLLIALSYLFRDQRLTRHRKTLVYFLCICLLGPGIVVNLLLKDHWGRPRPNQTIEFGGDRIFQPPFAPNFECGKCHSFVSGHASVGFSFFGLALLARKRKWLWLPVVAGSAIGLVRIAQGGHFLSDVIFSGWVVWFCSLLLYCLFYRRQNHHSNAASLERDPAGKD